MFLFSLLNAIENHDVHLVTDLLFLFGVKSFFPNLYSSFLVSFCVCVLFFLLLTEGLFVEVVARWCLRFSLGP